MSRLKVQRFSILTQIKIVSFILSVLLIFTYDLIPLRTKTLYPLETATLSLFSDESAGGNSRVSWLDQNRSAYQCLVKPSATAQFCGGTITWFDQEAVTYDFTDYQGLLLDIEYQGDTTNLIVNLYNLMSQGREETVTTEAKIMAANVKGKEFSRPVFVRFADFRVAEWWLMQHNIPRDRAHIEIDKVTSLGVAPTAPFSDNADLIQINAIYAIGPYFSREKLYASMLAFWAFLLASEGGFHYWSLRSRISRDAKKMQTLADISAQYKVKAETDMLTGLSNREGLAQTLKAIKINKNSADYSVLLLDIDYFKKLNDRHGHDVGDLVLEELAQIISSRIRHTDLVCRWGGEEFVILFRYADYRDIEIFADKVRLEIANTLFAGELKLSVTVSIGVAMMTQQNDFEKTFKRADIALYAAKRNGRNQIIIDESLS